MLRHDGDMTNARLQEPVILLGGPMERRGLPTPRPTTATAVIALSAVGFGLVPFFARSLTDTGMAAPAVTVFRWGFTAVLLLPFVRPRRDKVVSLSWGFAVGITVGLGWMAYVEALKSMPVPTISVIYMTYPIFAIVAARLLFSKRAGRRSVAGAVIVAVAAAIALSPSTMGSIGPMIVAVAFASPLAYGFGITVLAEGLDPLSPVERMAAIAGGALIAVLPLYLALPDSEKVSTKPGAWGLILGMGLLTSLLPKLGYSVAAPVVGSARVAIAGAVELPTMLVVGWLAFGESLGWSQLVAGVLILTAVCLTPLRQKVSPEAKGSRWHRSARRDGPPVVRPQHERRPCLNGS